VGEIRLSVRSGLEHLAVPARVGASGGEAGVTLALRDNVAIACVIARRTRQDETRQDELARRVRDAFGFDLPLSPRRHVAGTTAFVWAGPGRWLALAEGLAGHDFERGLRDELQGLASVCDQSDSHVLLRIAGKRVRDALAKEIMIDLHPRAFGPGDAAATVFGHVPVHFWQLDAAPSYQLAVSRSLAADCWHGLVEAAREFGVAVAAGN
jgi:heterotetrameric sarcosine oxidase gamma subunit